MRRIFSGFTIVELTVVLIILGILVTVAISHLGGAREAAMLREAVVNLKLIAVAELDYQQGADTYLNYSNSTSINSGLRLSLPLVNPNWNYKVVDANTTAFTAKAGRVKDGNVTVWCFNQSVETAYNGTGCAW